MGALINTMINYNDKLLYIPNVYSRQLQPYVKEGKLHFIGFRAYEKDELNNITLEFNDIELNLFE